MDFNAIDSSTVKGSVVKCLEESLLNRTHRILICTHESLRLINPETVHGWRLYVDEVPTTWDCSTYSFTDLSYRKAFGTLTDVTKIGDKSRINAKEDCRTLIEGLANGDDSTLTSDARSILKALLDCRYVVEVEELDAKLKRTIRIIGIKHYIPAFAAAEEAVIMGAEVEKTLLGIILKGAGWCIRPIEANIDFTGYGNKVEIHPFFRNRSYSKRSALMKAGKLYPDYQKDCLLDAWLKVDVFRIIGSRRAILVAHQWCKPELPVPQGHDDSNIKFIPIDNRGINEYSEYNIAICLQHGNITPMERRSLYTLAELLSIESTVTPNEIKDAVKYERFYESTLQSACRTALRSRTSLSSILLFVQDLDIANFLAENLGNCEINEAFSEDYIAPESALKTKKESLKQKAISLWEKKYNIDDIAKEIGKTPRTVRNWLSPYRKLQQAGRVEISS
ncbi:helix-turn-helix domain-containing protein [Pseudomonas sp. YuFO20]|uniref:helix-turn-helix domain-containing protein n=1 Tax=Pseudomonas sp. YuFO20 TaxID=3095362 RepID=UPI002B25473E|nr:helix-turn-helix domain-containing protein [Pseudomonas sp. YuFO20]MEB2517380.1 helix-turn-helix domain-containing protein [Pseudomonas sp. YuFO20]